VYFDKTISNKKDKHVTVLVHYLMKTCHRMKIQVARTVNPGNVRRTDTFKLQAFHVSLSGNMGQLHT
jgi:hypothetical protein